MQIRRFLCPLANAPLNVRQKFELTWKSFLDPSAFAINGTVDYSQMISDTQLQSGAVAPGTAATGLGSLYDLNWRRIQAFVGARYFF